MGRRKRRVIKVVKRKLPSVYNCPRCGINAVKVSYIEQNIAKVTCGSCNLSGNYSFERKKEVIDIYNMFVDDFMAGKIGE